MTPFEFSLSAKELAGSCIEAHFSFAKIYRLANKRWKIHSFLTGWSDDKEYGTLIEAFRSIPAEIKSIRPIEMPLQNS